MWQGIDSLWRELVEAGVRFDHDAKAFSQVGTTGLVLWKTLLDTERFPSENVLYESFGTKTYLSHTKFTSGKLYFEVKILHSTPSSSEKIKKGDPWMHVGWAKRAYEVLKQPQRSRRELSKGRFVICGSKNAKYWQGKKEAYGDQLDWKKGDVVGCVADLDGGEIRFLMNNKDLGVAFGSEELTRSVLDAGLRITCSFGPGQGAEVNLGNRTFVNTMPVGFRSVFSAVVREEVSKSDDYSDSKSFTMPWFEYKGGEFRLIRYAYRISYDGGILRTLIASIDFNAQFQTQSQDSCEWTNVGLCALDQVLKSSNSESAHTLEFAKILIHKMNLNQILHGAQEPLWVEIVRRLDSILEIDTEESLDFVLSIVGAHQQDILSDFQKSVIEKLLINVIRMEMSGRNFGLLRKSVGFIRKSMGISGSPSWKGLAFFVQELIDAGMDINRQAWKEIGVPFCVVMASELLQATPLSDANSITNKELEILKIQSVNKVQSGKVYFEVTLIGPAPDSSVRARRNTPWMHLGWSGESFRSVPTNALGADVHRRRRMSKGSYVVCGSKAKRYWKGQKESWGGTWRWQEGDVVGCSLDVEAREIRYYLNGKDLGAAFTKDELTSQELQEGLYITCSLGPKQGVKINLGESEFAHGLPAGFRSVQDIIADMQRRRGDAKADSQQSLSHRQSTRSLIETSLSDEDDRTWRWFHPIKLQWITLNPSMGGEKRKTLEIIVAHQKFLAEFVAYSLWCGKDGHQLILDKGHCGLVEYTAVDHLQENSAKCDICGQHISGLRERCRFCSFDICCRCSDALHLRDCRLLADCHLRKTTARDSKEKTEPVTMVAGGVLFQQIVRHLRVDQDLAYGILTEIFRRTDLAIIKENSKLQGLLADSVCSFACENQKLSLQILEIVMPALGSQELHRVKSVLGFSVLIDVLKYQKSQSKEKFKEIMGFQKEADDQVLIDDVLLNFLGHFEGLYMPSLLLQVQDPVVISNGYEPSLLLISHLLNDSCGVHMQGSSIFHTGGSSVASLRRGNLVCKAGVLRAGASKAYFEVTILGETPAASVRATKSTAWIHLGWSAVAFFPTQHVNMRRRMSEGSYVVCGSKAKRYWGGQKEDWGGKWRWQEGDVVGCSLDVEKHEIRYYLNGKDLGAAFTKEELTSKELTEGLYITCSLGPKQGVKINLGESDFVHALPKESVCVARVIDPQTVKWCSFDRTNQFWKDLMEIGYDEGIISLPTHMDMNGVISESLYRPFKIQDKVRVRTGLRDLFHTRWKRSFSQDGKVIEVSGQKDDVFKVEFPKSETGRFQAYELQSTDVTPHQDSTVGIFFVQNVLANRLLNKDFKRRMLRSIISAIDLDVNIIRAEMITKEDANSSPKIEFEINQIIPSDWVQGKEWGLDASHTFSKGEMCVVLRSDKSWRFGEVYDAVQDDKLVHVRVDTTEDGPITKHVDPCSSVGKIFVGASMKSRAVTFERKKRAVGEIVLGILRDSDVLDRPSALTDLSSSDRLEELFGAPGLDLVDQGGMSSKFESPSATEVLDEGMAPRPDCRLGARRDTFDSGPDGALTVCILLRFPKFPPSLDAQDTTHEHIDVHK